MEGADGKYFSITSAGVLSIKTTGDDAHTPNYEKQSSYSITVVAIGGTDDRRLAGKLNVTIKVTNAEDDGSVELSQIGPQEGRVVTATLTDEDGSVNISTWKWEYAPLGDNQKCNPGTGENGPVSDTWVVIPKATSASYTPKDYVSSGTTVDIANNCLRATATYTDGFKTADNPDTTANESIDTATEESDAVIQAAKTANAAPKFPDQDLTTPGDQSDETSRSVAENTAADKTIGTTVTAKDDDTADLLLYSLNGTDADSFAIDRRTGQIKTKAKLDYETKSTYMVVVTATDPSGAYDSISVTINVTDKDDEATISLNQAPAFAEDSAERSVDENSEAGTSVGDPVAATDPNAGQALAYALSGDDAAHFAIDEMGQITVAEGAMLDYEAEQNTYAVTVTATDPLGLSDSIAVTISVNDVKENDAPVFEDESYTRNVQENSAAGAAVGDPVTATDANEGDTITYSLADESGSFQIDSETGQITVAEDASLDYETQTGYTVTVTASDGQESASAEVTVNVGNVGLANPYDTDDSGSISKVEAVNAVKDYFDDELSREDVLAVIRLYFG